MRKTVAVFTVAMACALPLAASAHTSSSNQSSATQPISRGGGPEHPAHEHAAAAGSETHAQQMHEMSPHIITVQSKIDAAQAEVRGIERLASLERQPLTGVYGDHMRLFARDLQSDITSARHHLDELRSAAANAQVSAAANNDMAAADHSLQQARTEIEQFESAAGHAGAPAAVMDARAFGNSLSHDLNNAKSAMDRVEHALR